MTRDARWLFPLLLPLLLAVLTATAYTEWSAEPM